MIKESPIVPEFPIMILSDSDVVYELPALLPIQIFPDPVTRLIKADEPYTVFVPPVVRDMPEMNPTQVLLLADVRDDRVCVPIPTF
jgi:hypothetical protein